MKKMISLILVVLFFAAMAWTCPSRDAHYDAISEAYTDMNFVTKLAGKNIIKQGVERVVSVKNYVLVSVGTYTQKQDDINGVVSVGVFGHVYTFTKDDLMEELKRVF